MDNSQAKPGRARRALSAGEGRRAIIVSVAIVGVLMIGAFVTVGSYISIERESPISKVTLSPSSGNEAAHRVASVVMETDKKGRCEERRFDNRTGKMISATYVDCDARLEGERDTRSSDRINNERIRAILGAFRK